VPSGDHGLLIFIGHELNHTPHFISYSVPSNAPHSIGGSLHTQSDTVVYRGIGITIMACKNCHVKQSIATE